MADLGRRPAGDLVHAPGARLRPRRARGRPRRDRRLGILSGGVVATTAISGSLTVGDVAFPIIILAAFCLAGRTARSRARLAGELHEAAARASERRAARAERAVVEERKRIAREMHDVVAHSMSVMVVQAGGARRILERDPLRARDAAQLIADTGREAIVELRAPARRAAPRACGGAHACSTASTGSSSARGPRACRWR